MSTHVSFHRVESIRARTTGTSGAPLTLDFTGDDGTNSATIFTGDQELTDRLIAAINDAVTAHREDQSETTAA